VELGRAMIRPRQAAPDPAPAVDPPAEVAATPPSGPVEIQVPGGSLALHTDPASGPAIIALDLGHDVTIHDASPPIAVAFGFGGRCAGPGTLVVRPRRGRSVRIEGDGAATVRLDAGTPR